MNVIPFPSRAVEPELLAFAIGARVDLRVGALASGVIRPRGDEADAFRFSNLARLIRHARMAWKERGLYAPLSLSIPSALQSSLEGDMLSEAAMEAGCTRQALAFELCERRLVADGPGLAEALRARGWTIVLRGDNACPLPFSTRARTLYSELVLDVSDPADPFLALEDDDRTPLSRRVLAARAAGIVITAETVRSVAQARTLAIAGFDRGGGPFAEAGLR